MKSMGVNSAPSEDKYSGADVIESGDELEIEANRQMIVYRIFKNAGTIKISGTFILRSV